MKEMNDSYLASARQQFLYYKSLADKAIGQIDPTQLFESPGADSNSIAIIMQHMAGNMLSRWTDLLTTDGEKAWRQRDLEFEPLIKDKKSLLKRWEEGWSCLLNSINSLQPNQLTEIIRIRNEPHTVTEAINRQLAHYPYHVGQIVYIAKLFKGQAFTSLSIPKNKSTEFNHEKFLQGEKD